jgi:hypothetical protein
LIFRTVSGTSKGACFNLIEKGTSVLCELPQA